MSSPLIEGRRATWLVGASIMPFAVISMVGDVEQKYKKKQELLFNNSASCLALKSPGLLSRGLEPTWRR